MKILHRSIPMLGLCISALLLAAAAGCWPSRYANLSTYSGDGTIAQRGGGISAPGYRVTFDGFSLMAPFSAKYEFKGLPQVKDSVQVQVEFDSPLEVKEMREQLKGNLTLQLETSDGEKLFRCQAPMGEWRYSYHSVFAENGIKSHNHYEIYSYIGEPARLAGADRDDSVVDRRNLKPDQALRLSVGYDPGEGGADVKARVAIRAGGGFL